MQKVADIKKLIERALEGMPQHVREAWVGTGHTDRNEAVIRCQNGEEPDAVLCSMFPPHWVVVCAYDCPFGARGEVLKTCDTHEEAERVAKRIDPGGSWLAIRWG